MSKFKYITVLDFEKGQVYLYDFDPMTMRNAEEIVASRHSLDNVQYMVHRVAPALWTKNLYFCNREQAYSLDNAEKEQ
tara:strand:+ start:175 stop:408 length:234 start_codon:yes stop_codon:yes gene_type:complete